MSISEQQMDLGEGGSINPTFSIYSASMVGVFCSLILIMDSPLAVLSALAGLLFCYLLTCIFVFGSFRGVLGERSLERSSFWRANLPASLIVLFGLATFAALFGTYSALDPIAGTPSRHIAAGDTGGITYRTKQTNASVTVQTRQPDANQTIAKTDSRKGPISARARFDTPKPILAAARTDDFVGTREFRSHAWAVRETANLPPFLTLPKVLFSILYGDDTPAETVPDMVVAKQSSGGAARIMVSFLTTPQSSFKNHPAPKAGGHLVVVKRETVIAMQPPSQSVEPITVVAKAPAAQPVLVESEAEPANTTIVVARLEPAEARQRDPVAVTSTKQDLEEVTRTTETPLKPTAARAPEILLPPVLASIFYGRPSGAEPAKVVRRAPRLTTLTKTAARQTVRLIDPDPVTVVAKAAAPVQRRRDPIALAALADTHRISQGPSDGLGGPFSVALEAQSAAKQSPQDPQGEAGSALITGSVSPREINSAIRSLRFAPKVENRQAQEVVISKQRPNGKANSAKSDLRPIASAAQTVSSERFQAGVSRASGTVILKQDAPAKSRDTKVKLAALPDDSLRTDAASPQNKKQNVVRRIAPVSAPKTDVEASGEAAERPSKSQLSKDALREANEEIDSALRGAEADLKDTDDLLDEIDVIWSDQDKAAQGRKKRPDTNASVVPKLVPVSSRKGHVIIQPAASHTNSSPAQHAQEIVQLPVLTNSGRQDRIQLTDQNASVSAEGPQPRRQAPEQQLLGYISEKGSLKKNSRFVDCAVFGPDSKMRNCAKRGAL